MINCGDIKKNKQQQQIIIHRFLKDSLDEDYYTIDYLSLLLSRMIDWI